jgi:uncharacterized protein (TIGR02246 family)
MKRKKFPHAVRGSLTTNVCSAVLILLSLLLFNVSCGNERNSYTSEDNTADNEYLRNAGHEWDRLFNARDTSGLAALYADNAISMPYNAPTVYGRTAIQAEFNNFLAPNIARHETSIEEVLVKGDWAIERARYTMTYTPNATGTQVIETGRHVMCRKKVSGRWQIAWEIWNSDQPPR